MSAVDTPRAQALCAAFQSLPADDVEAYPASALVAVAKWGLTHGWPCQVFLADIQSGNRTAGCVYLQCEELKMDAWGNVTLSSIVGHIRALFDMPPTNYTIKASPQDINGLPDWLSSSQADMCHWMLAGLQARDLSQSTPAAVTESGARRL